MEVNEASLETAKILMPFLRRLHRNMARTDQLLNTSQQIGTIKDDRSVAAADDVLRAVVVFLHATLEDSLRSLAMLYLPVSGEEQLNGVPLIETGSAGRPEKFFLGKLATHRGKSVDEVIELSVAAHLARSTYNDTTEIASLLKSLGMNPAVVSMHFPALDKLIRRRHQIVHRADLSDENPEIPDHVRPISLEQVNEWKNAVKELTTELMAHIIGKEMGTRMAQGV
jgi:hypothetical protein